MKLGINGMGRIGKLTLWHHVARKHFSEIVVNLGRNVGQGLHHIAQSVEKDSTYGPLSRYLHGHACERVIENLDETAGTMTIDGMTVRFLRSHRNPKDIEWRRHGVRLVADCTGAFIDPTTPSEDPIGSVRGHLEAGSEKVVLSAPFRIKNQGLTMPGDAITAIMGINDMEIDPARHAMVSAGSCTTTCLAFMVKPLLDFFSSERILSASMVTIHAATSSQTVLDALPAAGAKDLRKNRSVLNNIILTTTGAAKALRLVLPEMGDIGFMAESVRVPVAAGSLIILTVNIQSDYHDQAINHNGASQDSINRTLINRVYQEAAEGAYQGYLHYSDDQNVSSDMIGNPRAATVIEGQETHTRTAYIHLKLARIPNLPPELGQALDTAALKVPVTQVVIYGWYDNELGSYSNTMGDLTVALSKRML